MRLRFTDLSAQSYGFEFEHSRDYGNGSAASSNGMNGFGWSNRFLPRLFVGTNAIVLSYTSLRYFYFDSQTDGSYKAKFKFSDFINLVHDPIEDEYRLFLPNGRVNFFGRFSETSQIYVLVRVQEANGDLITYSYDSNARIQSVFKGEAGLESGFTYAYVSGAQLVQSVTLTVKGNAVRRVNYTYYSSGDSGGTTGDLKTAVTQKFNFASSTWEDLGVSYHRYYLTGNPAGFVHGLKFVLEPEAYARAVASGLNPITATDAEISSFADYFFEYDANHRVALERTHGGAYSYRFNYSGNPNPGIANETGSESDPWLPPATGEFNSWASKTVVLLPDNTEEVVYCNVFGQAMLKVFRSSDGEWCRYFRYNDGGQIVLTAQPSAVAAYDEVLPHLVTLHAEHGLVKLMEYFASTASGGAPGRAKSVRVREGESGNEALLWRREYVGRAVSGDTSFFPAKDVQFVGMPGSSETAETSFSYEWHGSTAVFSERTTTLPIIPISQNGSGAANEFVEEFDSYGNRTRLTDQVGIIHEWAWDVGLNAITQQVLDVGGLDLTTDYDLDEEGRNTRELGPVHLIDVSGTLTSIRRAFWTLYLDATRQVRTAAGYIRTTVSEDPGILINPVSITQHDHAGRVVERIEAIRSTTTGPLLPSDTFPQADYARWSMSHFDDQSNLAFSRVYHDIPATGFGSEVVNYAETRYEYDPVGRQIQITSPAGTITRLVYNTRGSQIATWVGTNSAGATPSDPKAGNIAENDLVIVEARQYDRGLAGGDGLVTQVLAYVNSYQVRVSTIDYDYRGRRLAFHGENGYLETYVNDNQGRVVKAERWSDQGTLPILSGRNETLFDPLGRTYRTVRYSVDPATGEVGANLADDRWYDALGRVMKQRNPEDAGFEKRKYDAVSRLRNTFAGYNDVASSYAEAGSIANDSVFVQVDNSYDDAGNLIEEARRERFHDTTGTGPLAGPSGAPPNSRVIFTMMYPDAAGRVIASAAYGTNGGTAPARPEVVPSRSDDVLVTTFGYNDRGELAAVTDPKGTVTRQEFDDAGRLVKTIENFQP